MAGGWSLMQGWGGVGVGLELLNAAQPSSPEFPLRCWDPLAANTSIWPGVGDLQPFQAMPERSPWRFPAACHMSLEGFRSTFQPIDSSSAHNMDLEPRCPTYFCHKFINIYVNFWQASAGWERKGVNEHLYSKFEELECGGEEKFWNGIHKRGIFLLLAERVIVHMDLFLGVML